MKIYIPKEIYSKTVILKTAYKFTDDNYLHITSDKENYIVEIFSKNGKEELRVNDKFKNELIEQANREIVFSETKNIREMLFARAMASSVIFLDAEENSMELDIDDNSAMKDWFDK